MPTQNLPKMAFEATLLIHEATMGDDQEELAKSKAHSTIGQAIQIAREYVLCPILYPLPPHTHI